MAKIFCFLVFSTLNIYTVYSSNILGPKPRIISEDGHLRFLSAANRNISIETEGTGKVKINGMDVTEIAKMVQSAAYIFDKYKVNFEGAFNRIDLLDSVVFGKNGVIKKFEQLQATTKNFTSKANVALSDQNIMRLTRQINAAQNNLNTLTTLLTKDECQSNPCVNGGTCQDIFNDFICHCPDEWEGRLCDADVNECARFVGTDLGCQNGATCINKPGAYQCLCPNGWYGIHCTRRSKDCNSGSSFDLCGHGTCITQNTDLGYTCLCNQGWTNEGRSAECTKDVDECKMGHPPCSVNPLVSCINTPGSFRCGNCPAGYTGNGFYCTDMNECETANGGCSVNPKVDCMNTVGSRKCGSCPPGFIGDGITCSFKGICNLNNGGCHPLAKCRNHPSVGPTIVECVCPTGYIGSGLGPEGCTAVAWSACSSSPCVNGDCVATSNSSQGYICRCKPEFFGKNCERSFNSCASNPCRNGGTCSNVGMLFRCICKNPWTGLTCSREKSGCGGVLSSETGNLKFPPTNFSLNHEAHSCAWIIETNRNKVLTITFKKFNLKYTPNCNKAWLQVHDGRTSASFNIGRFCGYNSPLNGTLHSTHNALYLWYRTDDQLVGSGFELNWNSSLPNCSYFINATEHGRVQSPGSPAVYPNNRDCFWTIRAAPGKLLLFHFFSFDLGSSVNCTEDYLEFFPSSNTKRDPFAKYCNSSNLPSPLQSPGSVVVIHFHSDGSKQYPGFQISYSIQEGVPGCGGILSADHGEIRSPTYRGHYLSDMRCEFNIRLATGLRMNIEFISFDLEGGIGCKFDYVEIYEGHDTSGALVGRYCGKKPPGPYISNGNEVTIYFKSDWASNFEGFVIRYDTVCGGKFTDPTGIIVSDGYPSLYTPLLTCFYTIKQPAGFIIKLSFSEFRLEGSLEDEEGCFDYLEIRDGDNENATLIGSYCGVQKPPLIVSSFNNLWMKFVSDESVGAQGFKANYSVTNIGCGGIMTDKVGIISMKTTTTTAKNCNWVIKGPPGNVVRLTWITFQIGRYSIFHSYVAVFDNNTISGRGGQIGKYFGNKLPPSLISTSNIVTIRLTSNTPISNDEFTLSYNLVEEGKLCGGNYFSPGGVIRSATDLNRLYAASACTWTITVEQGHQISLNITKFPWKNMQSCSHGSLEIRNGKYPTSPLIGKFCGNTPITHSIISHTNQLFIRLERNVPQYGNREFEMVWESAATGCGGILTAPTGSIISPMYPESYGRFSDCNWKIAVSAGSLVEIMFVDLQLEQHSSCLLDYVELFDGNGMTDKSLGRFCTQSYPLLIRSTQNHVYIYFKSDVSNQGRGFRLQYSTACQNNITGFYGVIESPNFPYAYSVPQNCKWDIAVETGNKINLTFSYFDVRSHFDSINKNCSRDFLEIKYEGEVDDLPSMEEYGRYCGRLVKPPIVSLSHSHIQIRYITERSFIGTGFRLEWVLEGCGGKLYREGFIQSPNYPKGYPKSSACRWQLETDFGNIIELSFKEVEIEKSTNCTYDAIMVYNGPDKTYPLLGHFCHQDKPITLTSIGNRMSVYFTSDISYQGKGFYATFKTVKAECGGKIKLQKGTIVSPNYPNNYGQNVTCEWLLETDENHLIDLEFEDVQLPSTFCETTYIKIFDGPTTAYPVLKNICGVKPNRTITSTHNTLLILFKNTLHATRKGFKANFYKACGARIDATMEGSIQVHPYSLDSRQVNCSWTISAPQLNEHVSLTISHISIPTGECTLDESVNVYDGDSIKGNLLGQYCGPKVPSTITSTGNSLHVIVFPGIYFSAIYSVFDSTCGGILKAFQGSFTTPSYPKTYPFDMECEWTLHVSPGNHISLTFGEFDIPQSDKCKTDFLEIRKDNSSGDILGLFCGNTKPDNITNTGNLWLFFKSSPINPDTSLIKAKGFIADYSIDTFNLLTAPSGQIANPLYPDSLRTSGSFSWRISVTFGKKISIIFKELNIGTYSADECTDTLIEFYDGINDENTLLKTVCGFDIPEPIKTSSNEIFINADVYPFSNVKFLLEWQEIESSNDEARKNTTIEGCGSKDIINLNDLRNFTLKSPGYPYGYDNDLECEWIFSTVPSNHLTIYFDSIDLETYYGQFYYCFLDYIDIYNGKGGTQNWELVKRICTTNETDSFFSTSNLMKIKFKSNYNENGTGFMGTIREACGGSIQQSEGVIIIDKDHPRGSVCEWNITVRSGRTIQIEFPTFELRKSNDGDCYDYIMLRNGILPDSPIIGAGKYCGSNPGNLNTTGNKLKINFFGSRNAKGFTMKFKEVALACGGTIELTNFENSTTISSPNYPNIPMPHTDCIWIIRSIPGTRIQIDFKERFDLTIAKDCSKEFVELRNGATEFSPLIGRFCKNSPSTQFSTDNMMYIKFFTDAEYPRNGFKAVASFASCGGTLRDLKGTIRWKSSDRGNHQNQNCTWYIDVPSDYAIKLKIEDLHFRFIPTASNSSLQGIIAIYSKETTEKLVKKITSNTDRSEIYINGNKAIIRFQDRIRRNTILFSDEFRISYTTVKQNCSFQLNSARGVVKSPGYPRRTTSFLNCQWTITVPEGRRISLTFVHLDRVDNINSPDYGIGIFDNNEVIIPSSFIRLKGDKLGTVQTIKSSSNTMKIFYWSMFENSGGFFALYSSTEETLCKGSFNEASGTFTTINSTRFVCSWKRRQLNANTTLKISFNMHINFDPSPDYYCRHSKGGVSIFSEGPKRLFQFHLCANTTSPVVFRTSSPKLDLQIWGLDHAVNYTINYDTYNCGGIKKDEMGFIASPNFPNKPSSNFECSWLLKLPQDQQINLTFNNFNLGDNCDKSFIEIYNGESHMEPKIVKLCKNPPPYVVSARNILLIDYHFEVDSTGTGFNLTYKPIIKGCGGIFHEPTRIIQTPSYPKDYPADTECIWEIRASSGYHIKLSFMNRFHLEESENCADDFVKVWDSKKDEWDLVDSFCGRKQPSPISSTENKMKVLFRSNDKIQASGFQAQWKFECGGTVTATDELRYIVSPGYPQKYPNNIKCEYKINALEEDKYVVLEFFDFNLELGMPSCKSDNLTIQSLSPYFKTTGRSIFCGNAKPSVDNYKSGAIVTFITDSWVARRGFKFSYRSYGCGGNITSPQKINSPKLSSSKKSPFYYDNMRCQWNIKAPEKKIIVIRFERFNVPSSIGLACAYGNLIIYDGVELQNDKKLATLCGNLTNSLPTIATPNNTASVVTSVELANEKFDFSMDIFFSAGPAEGCGGTLNLTSTKTIQSPNIDEIVDCNWNIIAPPDSQIEVEITDLNLFSCKKGNCHCSFLELRDGGSPMSTLIKKMCDSNNFQSTKYLTSNRYGFVRFHLEESISSTKSNFRVILKAVESKCQSSILNVTNVTQTLTSPNYPNQYPENIRCSWLLKANENKRMILVFKDFDLSDEGAVQSSCQNDFMEIETGNQLELYGKGLGPETVFSGRGTTSKTSYFDYASGVHVFCGRKKKQFNYFPTANEVAIILQSKYGQNRGRGFKIEYQLLGCPRNYSSDSGKIVILIDQKSECIFEVNVSKNKTIALYFSKSVTYYSANCTKSSLEIVDGDLKTGNQLQKWCGFSLISPLFSNTNKLSFKLKVDSDYPVAVFEISYTSTDKGRGCGGSLNDISGIFTSPMYPKEYRNDTLCTWNVDGPIGSRLELQLPIFDIQADCDKNYLNITTYQQGLSNLHTFCAKDEPATLYSDEKIIVTYQSSVHNGGKGWQAEFKTVAN